MKDTIGIKIEGGKVDSEGVLAVSNAVMAILENPHNDQKTKRLALKAISKSASAEAPNYSNISGVNIEMRQPESVVEVEDCEKFNN